MVKSPKKVLFFYLSAFGNTGGIEKFNQCFIKALEELRLKTFVEHEVISVYDDQADERYRGNIRFKGFGKNRGKSVIAVLRRVAKFDVLILGHANLLSIGLLAKLLNPRCKLILIAHGIEVWKKFSLLEKLAIQRCEMLLAVSTYTKNQIVLRNNISAKKVQLFPNTLDPYFSVPSTFERPAYLVDRYGLKKGQHVIYTLARLFWSEKNKGYDNIIRSLPKILEHYPDVVYILGGKFDSRERERIDKLILECNVEANVILPGYIHDNEKADHYLLADVFVLPSRKEGFGIVFLEALVCGTPVIGGNQDGTVDALHNGSLGYLINPQSEKDIQNAIIEAISDSDKSKSSMYQQSILRNYHFSTFVDRLAAVLSLN
jgi:glycosyltransferase involved in cell wall biosynthesis